MLQVPRSLHLAKVTHSCGCISCFCCPKKQVTRCILNASTAQKRPHGKKIYSATPLSKAGSKWQLNSWEFRAFGGRTGQNALSPLLFVSRVYRRGFFMN